MHLSSNKLSAVAMISSLITTKLFPGWLSCIYNSFLSQSSLGLEDTKFVIEKVFSL